MLRNFRIVLVLMLALLIPVTAQADLMRGSGGEEVIALQRMLFDMGYLFEEPDGQFGGKTEAAVKEYQQAAGLEATGVVTDALLADVCQDWADYQAWIYEQAIVDSESHYSPFCYAWENTDGTMVTQQCEKHALLWENTLGMLADGDADSAEYSYSEWQAEIISLYNEWISLVSAPVQAQIEANKALCIQLMQNQRSVMFDSYAEADAEIDPTDVYYGAELWMRSHAMWLCQMLSTIGAE